MYALTGLIITFYFQSSVHAYRALAVFTNLRHAKFGVFNNNNN